MTGEQRLKQLGLNPKTIWFVSPGGNDYTFWFNANSAYDEQWDSFRMLQHTGLYGGRKAIWVKAKTLGKSWTQSPY